jgi:hypothetical protein
MWLRGLRAKGYVEWIYSTDFAEKTKPAIYYLKLNGVRYFRNIIISGKDGEALPAYPPEELRRRYKEPTRSQTFIDRCSLIADCALALKREDAENETKSKKLRYYYQTEADYLLERSYYHFVLDSELIQPHLIFCQDKLDKDGKEVATVESYIFEVFDTTLPRYRIKKRLSNYVGFLDDEGDEWRERTETEQLPVVLFVCPRTSDLIYAKRRTRGLIANAWEWEGDDTERPRIRFTTVDKLNQSEILSKEIWEQA